MIYIKMSNCIDECVSVSIRQTENVYSVAIIVWWFFFLSFSLLFFFIYLGLTALYLNKRQCRWFNGRTHWPKDFKCSIIVNKFHNYWIFYTLYSRSLASSFARLLARMLIHSFTHSLFYTCVHANTHAHAVQPTNSSSPYIFSIIFFY